MKRAFGPGERGLELLVVKQRPSRRPFQFSLRTLLFFVLWTGLCGSFIVLFQSSLRWLGILGLLGEALVVVLLVFEPPIGK